MPLRVAFVIALLLTSWAPPVDAGSTSGQSAGHPRLVRRVRGDRPAARRPRAPRARSAFRGWRIASDIKPVGGVLIGVPGTFDAYYSSLVSSLPRHLKVLVAGKMDRLGPEAAGLAVEPIGADFTMAMWSRDYTPFLVRGPGGRKRMVQFEHSEGSTALGRALADRVGIPLYRSPLKLEGGNLVADSRGNIFLSNVVLARNSKHPRARIERHLRHMLGARSITWVEPLAREVTGHIDVFVKYAGRAGGRDVMVVSDSPDPERHASLDRTAALLARRGYKVLRLMNHEASGTPFSYAQAVLLDGAERVALVPSYDEPTLDATTRADVQLRDADAQRLYRDLGYRVVPLRARELMKSGLGSTHCTIRELWSDIL